MRNGGCNSKNAYHDGWRNNCVKTCGYCFDARYNGASWPVCPAACLARIWLSDKRCAMLCTPRIVIHQKNRLRNNLIDLSACLRASACFASSSLRPRPRAEHDIVAPAHSAPSEHGSLLHTARWRLHLKPQSGVKAPLLIRRGMQGHNKRLCSSCEERWVQ